MSSSHLETSLFIILRWSSHLLQTPWWQSTNQMLTSNSSYLGSPANQRRTIPNLLVGIEFCMDGKEYLGSCLCLLKICKIEWRNQHFSTSQSWSSNGSKEVAFPSKKKGIYAWIQKWPLGTNPNMLDELTISDWYRCTCLESCSS
jgi:hypothetical protein